ncbi:MAG: UbiA family prenyltransferase [Nitrososphaeraceae archaeon]
MKKPNFRDYLILVRLPNLFTLPSNILVGLVIVSALTQTTYVQVLLLVTISILHYCVGIILNDLCDFNIDKKERPYRPLPSGKISRKIAIALVTIFSFLALTLSLMVGIPTLVISSILFAIIFGYDKYLKNTWAGPFTIASARVMNIMLGVSVNINSASSNPQFVILTFVLTITLVYVSLIGYMSRFEIHGFSNNVKLFLTPAVIAMIISSIILFTLTGFFKYDSLVILALFSFIMFVTFHKIHKKDSLGIQQIIQNMILSIIVLDSTFLSGIRGIEMGLIVLVLLAPMLVFAKKMYMT